MNGWPGRIKEMWIKHEPKIVLAAGFILVAVLSFEAGILKGQKSQEKPIIIEKPAVSSVQRDNIIQDAPQAQKTALEASNALEVDSKPVENCAFVGSKNSNKYHLPTCQFAKRIKPENITCFKDKIEAESKGYLPDKGCVKN